MIDLLARIPHGLLLLTVALAVLVLVEAGLALGRRLGAGKSPGDGGPIGSVVGAMMGLVAFLLAFTFGMAADRFDQRRQLLLRDANSIGTTWLRASLIPEPHRGEARRLLREYVALRLRLADEPSAFSEVIARSSQLQAELWSHTEQVVALAGESRVLALWIDSLNETIDLQTDRVAVGVQYRIPVPIWSALFLITAVALLSVGYHFGLSGTRNVPITVALACSFSLVLTLIVELDRPMRGRVRVDQQPMIELYQQIKGDGR